MDFRNRFRAAVEAAASDGDLRLLPKLLATACAETLPVAGAGISVIDEIRIPLGSSDPVAARAERLQTTIGDGPCLVAAGLPRPVATGWTALAERWPIYAHELFDQTPYRSVASLPLQHVTEGPFGAIDLYSTRAEAIAPSLLAAAYTEVAVQVAALLVASASAVGSSDPLAPWLAAGPAEDRLTVWRAVGILLARSSLDNADALALLRAFAYTKGITLDAAAARLTRGEIEPATVIDAERPA
jgi:hypothetical protein